MTTVVQDRSGDKVRQTRDKLATATTTVVANYNAARSTWTQTTVPFDTPPQSGTTVAWVFS